MVLFKSTRQHLSMAKGLEIPDPSKPIIFVDYFYDNRELVQGMDTFRSYNYRLSSYIDIDPDGSLGSTDPALKYLFSRPTERTGWIRPTFPEIENIKPSQSQVPDLTLIAPVVSFEFKVISTPLNFVNKANRAKDIFYRIIVKKKINNSISTFFDKAKGHIYEEIGKAINLYIYATTSSEPVIDQKLEREDQLSELSIDYLIEISVVAIDNQGKEYFLRKAKISPLNVKLSSLKNGEVKKTVLIEIG